MRHSKTILVLFFFSLMIFCATAQVQKGYVRTIGRPDTPGKPIPGVVIRVRGMIDKYITSNDGYFEMVMRDKKKGDPIYFMSVSKKDYELCDKNFLSYNSVYSPEVTLEITMIDLKQFEKDKQRIEENAYKVAETNYEKKKKELERQKEKSEITIEKYRKELENLQNSYERYISLIGVMADRYARSDYDHMDSIDYEINICIENGELDRADSLIHTVFDPYTVLERNRAAKAEIRERIEFAQAVIDKAQSDKAALERDKEYAVRVMRLGELLADEYRLEGSTLKAEECLEKALGIAIYLYGEESEEVSRIKNKLKR